MKASRDLLIRQGRILTPRSRLRYRWLRLRTGRAVFLQSGAGLAAVGAVARLATLPLFLLVDLLWWPLARMTVARSSWWVVRVDFHGVDAEFVRIAEATSKEDAERLRDQIASRRGSH